MVHTVADKKALAVAGVQEAFVHASLVPHKPRMLANAKVDTTEARNDNTLWSCIL